MVRVPNVLAFVAILIACLAGAFSVSWWLACTAAAMLLLVSLGEQQPAYGRYAARGLLGARSMPLLGTAINAATAAAVGFALGRPLASFWGL